jgi:hypothetical protein
MNPAIPPVGGGARDFHPKNVTYDIQKMRHTRSKKVILITASKMEEINI